MCTVGVVVVEFDSDVGAGRNYPFVPVRWMFVARAFCGDVSDVVAVAGGDGVDVGEFAGNGLAFRYAGIHFDVAGAYSNAAVQQGGVAVALGGVEEQDVVFCVSGVAESEFGLVAVSSDVDGVSVAVDDAVWFVPHLLGADDAGEYESVSEFECH